MCHLQALVKKGLIRREPNMSRAISVIGKHPPKGSPLAGRISAGQPVQMYEQTERVDFGDMFTNKSYYALEVRGQSMIDDHIQDGDFVVIRKQETARDGQVVVAVVAGQDATLKRFYREKGGKFRLEPANGNMKPIITKDVQIYGVLIGVVRKYNTVNCYYVGDLARARDWYSQVLGFPPYFDQPFYVGFSVGGFELGLMPDGERAGQGGTVAYWGVPNVVEAVQRLLGFGASAFEDPEDVGEGIKVAAVLDPFGNILGVIENPHFNLGDVR
jgi:repressor LexA